MAASMRTGRGRRARLAIAGAAVLTALITATAGAAVPPRQIPTAPATQPDHRAASTAAWSAAGRKATAGPRSRFPVFVLEKGRYTGFDSPGEVTNDSLVRINNRGQIAGAYIQDYSEDSSGAPQGRSRGFLRDQHGRTITISVPGAAGTTPYDFNDAGTVVGIYSDESLNRTDDLRSFLRDARGRYTRIVVPGATQVQARAINNRGLLVGEYRDASGAFHGFRWQRGRVTSFDDAPAGAVTVCSPLDVNDRGQMVGVYLDAGGALHGCLLDRDRAVTIDAPGVPLTLPIAINNRGRIVGATSTGPGQPAHGFLLRDGAGGPFTPIDVPGAPGTGATGINDAGTIVGSYENPAAPSQQLARRRQAPAPTPPMDPRGLPTATG
jgi:uncharacterized membrane protein